MKNAKVDDNKVHAEEAATAKSFYGVILFNWSGTVEWFVSKSWTDKEFFDSTYKPCFENGRAPEFLDGSSTDVNDLSTGEDGWLVYHEPFDCPKCAATAVKAKLRECAEQFARFVKS
jgi:hypothetical protein